MLIFCLKQSLHCSCRNACTNSVLQNTIMLILKTRIRTDRASCAACNNFLQFNDCLHKYCYSKPSIDLAIDIDINIITV